MGAAAFHNEMINQLAEAYLTYRQKELREAGRVEWKVEPDKYKEELQKIKAYIATNNTYGVDLNPTAIELGKLSLWLNVIHRDMETPFFSNRIGVGNAVVGAWLRVYKAQDVALPEGGGRRAAAREWWESAPRQLEFKPQTDGDKIKHGRKADEIYHFLLPDKGMVPSAGIKMLKDENPEAARRVTTWKKEFIKPLGKAEVTKLQRICEHIDVLLAEYYRFQVSLNVQTSNRQNLFGMTGKGDQVTMQLRSYDEKERLADQRNRHNAPYYKLKMVMDYWCSLWFWDMRRADVLPDRNRWWDDIASILELDADSAAAAIIESRGQRRMFDTATQTALPLHVSDAGEQSAALFTETIVATTDKGDLFDTNERLQLVANLANTYRFFHPQLEFLEVFWERGGFDLIAGNPPWLKVVFETRNVLCEFDPQIIISNKTAAEVEENLVNNVQAVKIALINEEIEITSLACFMGGAQNYFQLVKQQADLYKAILVNSLNLGNPNGFIGLIHPQTVFEDTKGHRMRILLFRRLQYIFQFRNELTLFPIGHTRQFGICIYKGSITSEVSFEAIFNLFHPGTIDQSFSLNFDKKEVPGLKILNSETGKYNWDIRGHSERVIHFTNEVLEILKLVEGDALESNQTPKLVSFHTRSDISVLQKIFKVQGRIKSLDNYYITEGWHETNDVIKGNLIDLSCSTEVAKNLDFYVFGGPQIHICNPYYRSPKSIVRNHHDYENIHFDDVDLIVHPKSRFKISDAGFEKINKRWVSNYKVAFNKMIDSGVERTIQPCILNQKATHTGSLISISLNDKYSLLGICGLTSSILFDFFIKCSKKANVSASLIESIPIINSKNDLLINALYCRVARLNCISEAHKLLWNEIYKESFKSQKWSNASANQLDSFSQLSINYTRITPIRSAYVRRLALIEIDIIIAMLFGVKLEELLSIYKAFFPITNQYEEDTWYDQTGFIVFTNNSQGLKGIGVERSIWETIRHLNAGETYEHTITKSELYYGKKVTYHAPFDKCDRVEDYKVAWRWFEGVFKSNG
jgi:hypothetical protein